MLRCRASPGGSENHPHRSPAASLLPQRNVQPSPLSECASPKPSCDVSRIETPRHSLSFCLLWAFLPSVPGDCVHFTLAQPLLSKAAEVTETPQLSPPGSSPMTGGCCHLVVTLGIALCGNQPESMKNAVKGGFENHENTKCKSFRARANRIGSLRVKHTW